ARLVDVSAGRNEFGACGLSNSNLCVFFSAFVYDWYNCSDCLNVVDHGRTIPESFHGWERRLDPRISALTFERFEQRSFFSADVRTCTAMHENFTVESRSEYVLAEKSVVLCFLNCLFENVDDPGIFAAYVDV